MILNGDQKKLSHDRCSKHVKAKEGSTEEKIGIFDLITIQKITNKIKSQMEINWDSYLEYKQRFDFFKCKLTNDNTLFSPIKLP